MMSVAAQDRYPSYKETGKETYSSSMVMDNINNYIREANTTYTENQKSMFGKFQNTFFGPAISARQMEECKDILFPLIACYDRAKAIKERNEVTVDDYAFIEANRKAAEEAVKRTEAEKARERGEPAKAASTQDTELQEIKASDIPSPAAIYEERAKALSDHISNYARSFRGPKDSQIRISDFFYQHYHGLKKEMEAGKPQSAKSSGPKFTPGGKPKTD